MRVIDARVDKYMYFKHGYHFIQRGDGGYEMHKQCKIRTESGFIFCNEDGQTREVPFSHGKVESNFGT